MKRFRESQMPILSLAMPPCRVLLRMLVLGCSLFVMPLSQAACEVSLRWDDDPPYSMQLADGSIGGIYVDSTRAVLGELGCTTRLVRLPWARALRELEYGRLDVLPGAFRKPEREVYAHFSGAIVESSRNILFMRHDAAERWPVTNLLQLRDTPFRLGAQIDVSYGPDYQTLLQDAAFAERVEFNAARSNLWRMVAKGRVDGVIADEHTGQYELLQLGLDELIQPTAVVVSSGAAEVAFSKKSVQPEFVQRFADALRAQVADGRYARIVQRYVAH